MKFTNGYWCVRDGWTVETPKEIQTVEQIDETSVVAFAPTRYLVNKGSELDATIATITLSAVQDDVVKVRIEHFQGYNEPKPTFSYTTAASTTLEAAADRATKTAHVTAGALTATISETNGFGIDFTVGDKVITSSILRSQGIAVSPKGKKYIHEQLTINPNEVVYGLGERFGPVVRNGQSFDLWNEDGGTNTDKAYKNIPFYMTNKGYGVIINHPERVSLEIGSEVNTRVQFSVPGEFLEYMVIYGPTPKDILTKYTALTGRAPQVPDWTYGLWLSTSFTTDYSEESVNGFLDKMEEYDIPMSVLHFDCYWMRPSHWCDFVWDPDKFADPKAMLQRYHERGIKVCVWINPYIGQQSHLFAEGKANGYLLTKADGTVRQWDHWQSGMAWVDFTNPAAVAWWQNELKKLLHQGVDAFKTDFGERVPTDVVWHDGSDPMLMHNYYSYLYNKAVFEVLEEVKGKNEAIVFARSGTLGAQQFPVHWGGDSEPTFVSMHETLRGGLSASLSGIGLWSHDMGGFEGQPNNDVFIRWFPFGMFSSHSRLHGSSSFRVPWLYGEDAVRTARKYSKMKNELMPYIGRVAREVTDTGIPMLRHMIMEYPGDYGSHHVDTQYLFGPDLLVAPVFTSTGDVDFYLPTPGWTHIETGERYEQPGWYHQQCAIDTLPVLAPDGTILPVGANDHQPDYDHLHDVCLYLFAPQAGTKHVVVYDTDGNAQSFTVTVEGNRVEVTAPTVAQSWSVCYVGDLAQSAIESGTLGSSTDNYLVKGTRILPAASGAPIVFTLPGM